MSKPLTHQQRYLIKEMVNQGCTKKQISEALNISIHSARKWMRRAKKDEPSSKMGRPKQGNLSTFTSKMIEKVKKLGDQKPGWGGKSIRVELLKQQEKIQQDVPSSSSINRYLQEKGMVKKYEKRTEHPATSVIKSKRPHHVWQLDAEGNNHLDDVGTFAPINIKDTYTTIYIHSYAPCLINLVILKQKITNG